MNCTDGKSIIIVRGNDTNWNGANFLTINLITEILDLSTFKAIFTLGNIIKTIDDVSSGSIEVNLSAQETKNLPPSFNGVLKLIDGTGKIATIESLIPFKVISNVHGNAIATEPYTLNFDVKQGDENILTVNVESAVTVEVGTTTTLPAGSDATVTNSGTLNHLVLDFGIPQGIQGVPGQDGVSPTASVTPTSSGATITITDAQGTSTASITNGQDGTDGTNATITGATATVNNQVGTPSVTVTSGGTEFARSFNFDFKNLKGDKGDTGAGMVAEVVQTLPVTGETGKIYLVPKENPEQQDIYDEWIWAIVTSPDTYGWEHIGSTEVDLTGVVKSVNNTYPDVDGNVTLSIPTDTSDLTNGAGFITSSALTGYATETWVGNQGYITGITSSDVTTALGYTPEQSMTIQTLSATDSITLADNTIYNGGEQTALTITLPSTVDVSFLCEIDFTSGTTATTLTYSNTIKWAGDDVNNNIFLPVASKRYTIICAYDGVNYRFTVKGVE